MRPQVITDLKSHGYSRNDLEDMNMARIPRQWVYSPRPASRVPDAIKEQVTTKANEIIETVFKPQYLKPPPEQAKFSYIVDIYTKWHKNCLYFRARFACPVPTHYRRSSRIALLGLPIWRTALLIWRTCGTPASGGKYSPTCRW